MSLKREIKGVRAYGLARAALHHGSHVWLVPYVHLVCPAGDEKLTALASETMCQVDRLEPSVVPQIYGSVRGHDYTQCGPFKLAAGW